MDEDRVEEMRMHLGCQLDALVDAMEALYPDVPRKEIIDFIEGWAVNS